MRFAQSTPFYAVIAACFDCTSLPSRGAWIEIAILDHFRLARPVAPLAGSVD